MWGWREYVPVGERIVKGKRKLKKILKKGTVAEPIKIEGRKIAKKFWGKQWCDHLEAFSDYSNRLPRGRTYARNGSICHLAISNGHVKAYVAGSSLYKIEISITPLAEEKWDIIKKKSNNQVGSLLELLKGTFSDDVMKIVTDPQAGLFPKESEIRYECDCPDWAYMCKHVAAAFYGIGSRLDEKPDLLFLLRGVDPNELIIPEWIDDSATSDNVLSEEGLSDLFGVEMDDEVIDHPMRPSTEKKTIYITGTQIRETRIAAQLRVKEFAEKLGVTPATIYRWEKMDGSINLQDTSKQAFLSFLSKLGSSCH